MRDVMGSMVGEVLSVLLYSILALVTTGLGLFFESIGLQNLLSGNHIVGIWYVYVGVIGLYIGVYALGYRKVWPRIQPVMRTTISA